MKPEGTVTSIELSQKLQRLGVKQDKPCFLWYRRKECGVVSPWIFKQTKYLWCEDYKYSSIEQYKAFSVEELLLLLGDVYTNRFYGDNDEWHIRAACHQLDSVFTTSSDTMAEALGLLLVKVLEEANNEA